MKAFSYVVKKAGAAKLIVALCRELRIAHYVNALVD